MFPNPVKDELNIQNIHLAHSSDLKIEIIDLQGKIVKSFNSNENSIYNVSLLKAGTYILQIGNSIQKGSTVFIKQ